MSKLDKRFLMNKKFNELQKIVEKKYESQDLDLSTPLYHFTKLDAFHNIIKSKNLLLSRFDGMNDPDEFNFTKKIIDTIIDKYPSKYATIFKNGFEDFLSNIDVFSISFCLDINNDHLWEKYAEDHKGIALGVDLNYNPDPKGRYTSYWPAVCMAVKYGQPQVLSDFEEFTETFAKLLKLIPNIAVLNKYAEIFVKNLYVHMPRYKDEKWMDEKEHRWCMMDRGPTLKILSKFKSGDKALLKNIVIEQLQEVIIGKDSIENVSSIEKLLEDSGYDLSKINVTKRT